MQKNVPVGDLESCSDQPVTGFYRNGRCETDEHDFDMHALCAKPTRESLEFFKARGNDLVFARPGFSGSEARRPIMYMRAALEVLELEVPAKWSKTP